MFLEYADINTIINLYTARKVKYTYLYKATRKSS